MSYRLKKNETIADGIKRLVSEQLDAAVQRLASGDKREEAIHEARKSLKKVRGALRLMRPELGPVYREENRRLRDVARQISEVRDAAAIIEVFDSLIEKHKASLPESGFPSIRHALEAAKHEMEKSIGIDDVMKQAQAGLHGTRRRVPDWPLKKDGFPALAPGLRATYRKGRKALRTLQSQPADVNYHELRKRVKDQWYHIRLLEGIWTENLHAREASLNNLETWLGDDHNLAILCERVRSQPDSYGKAQEVNAFLVLAEQEQANLRADAMPLAQFLYAEKAAHFVREIESAWDAWQTESRTRSSSTKPPAKRPSKAAAKARSTAA